MTDVADLGLEVGAQVQFRGAIGKLDFPLLVVNADVFYFFLPGDVLDDLVDVVAGVEHHGIVGAQQDGVAQAVGAPDDVLHGTLLLVLDVEVGPRRNGHQQGQAHGQDQLGQEPGGYFFQKSNHSDPSLLFAAPRAPGFFPMVGIRPPPWPRTPRSWPG